MRPEGLKEIHNTLKDIKAMLTMVQQAIKAVEDRLAFEEDDIINLSQEPSMLTTIKPNFEYLNRKEPRDISETWNNRKSREDRLVYLLKHQMKHTFEKYSLEELYIPTEVAFYQRLLCKSEDICREYVKSVTENGFCCPSDDFYSKCELEIANKLKKYYIEPQRCANMWAARLWCAPYVHTEVTFGVQKLIILNPDEDDAMSDN